MIKIIDNTQTVNNFEFAVGQFFKDVSAENLYHIVKIGTSHYSLVNIKTVIAYSFEPSKTIADVFYGDFDDFVLVNDVTITIS